MKLSSIILAAGKGTRMEVANLPKVLVKLKDKPLIGYVLDTLEELNSSKNVVVVGYEKEQVIDFLDKSNYSNITTVEQKKQLGTGHAVNQADKELINSNTNVLILCGDVPLLSSKSLKQLVDYHEDTKSDITVLSAIVDDPHGYGRIVRDSKGNFNKIVEEKDANEDIRKVKEINSGTYIVNSEILFNALDKVKNDNAQQEYYLTDIVEIIKDQDGKVSAFTIDNVHEIQGINSLEDLQAAEKTLLSNNYKPFNILGIQQIAIGSKNKSNNLKLWSDLFGLDKVGEFKSVEENVDEDILKLGNSFNEVEIDIMEPLNPNKKPLVSNTPLNHIGLWVDNLKQCYNYLEKQGVRFTPGGIRKGASGHDICFIHPKPNDEYPLSGDGVLIELVQAPQNIIDNKLN